MLLFTKSVNLVLLIAALTLGSQFAYTQDLIKRQIDSTLKTITNQKFAEKKEAYLFISRKVGAQEADQEALFRYVLSKDSSDICKLVLYAKLSRLLSRKGDSEQALTLNLLGIKLAEKLNDMESILVFNIAAGMNYTYLSIPDKALTYLNKAELLAENTEYDYFLWNVYYQRGLVQNLLGNHEAERDEYLKMWEATKDFENNTEKRFVLYILVDFLAQTDQHEELAKFTEILAELYAEANPNTPEGHMPIRSIFEKRVDPENIPMLEKSVRISDSLNSLNTLTFSALALAQTYTSIDQNEKAIAVLKKVEKKLSTVNKPQLRLHIFSELSRISSETGNFKDAFNYISLESNIRDSISSERMQRNIAELEVKFDTEKKERKIAEQQLLIEKETLIKNQIFIGLIALAILLIISIVFFKKRLKYQRTIASQTEEIQQSAITELQQKNKLLALNSMIEGQEAERLRIAKDLHDSLGGLLSTVKAHFTIIQKEIEHIEALNITAKTNSLIDEACVEVRRISHNMMPHALSISGLKAAVEDIVQNLAEEGYKVELDINNLPVKIENTKEVMIYRLVQEIISNIRKHAEADKVLLQLFGTSNQLNLVVEDNGIGFLYKNAVENNGLGIKSINSRVDYLDGTIDWDSQPGKGTTITINIPI